MGIIFYLSSLKGFNFHYLLSSYDKVIHSGIYAILAFLSYFSLKKSGVKKWVFLLALVLTTIYGITDEIHQFYVSYRVASVGDVIADFIGAFLGSFLASVISARRMR